jgi:hypothetical protein
MCSPAHADARACVGCLALPSAALGKTPRPAPAKIVHGVLLKSQPSWQDQSKGSSSAVRRSPRMAAFRSATDSNGSILLKNSFSEVARKMTGPQTRRWFSDVGDHAIFCCAPPSAF